MTPRPVLHNTIAGVRADYAGCAFNTAVAKLIELNNADQAGRRGPRAAAEALVLMVAPIAPHIAEELWAGWATTSRSVHAVPGGRPGAPGRRDGHLCRPGQGKGARPGRGPSDIDEDDLRALVLARARGGQAATADGVRTVIVRAPSLVNVVPA